MNFLLQRGLQVGAGDAGIVARVVKPLYEFVRKTVLTGKQRTFTQPLLIGFVLMLVLYLNFYRRRFFCNSICPLGAFYGIFARYSLIHLKTTGECKGCNACANHCTYYGSPYQDYLKSECLLCFNCVADCPHSAVAVEWPRSLKKSRPAVDIGRRRMFASLGSGLALAAFPAIAVFQKSKFHEFIRPPGSVREKDFLKKCIRCGECMQVCPTNAIRINPAEPEYITRYPWTLSTVEEIHYKAQTGEYLLRGFGTAGQTPNFDMITVVPSQIAPVVSWPLGKGSLAVSRKRRMLASLSPGMSMLITSNPSG